MTWIAIWKWKCEWFGLHCESESVKVIEMRTKVVLIKKTELNELFCNMKVKMWKWECESDWNENKVGLIKKTVIEVNDLDCVGCTSTAPFWEREQNSFYKGSKRMT